MHEFDLIEKYFMRPHAQNKNLILGIGDDCALLDIPAGYELAVTTDTLVAGVHFPLNTSPFDIGYKALAVNLSDLAAMGAQPAYVTLALTLPEIKEEWLSELMRGFFSLADEFNIALIGGDTTRGPLSITVQAFGLVPKGRAIRRSGAKAGDLIMVTGPLGLAAWGLAQLKKGQAVDPQALAKLNRPYPRVHESLALRDHIHAMIDISDGLAADLGHILKASGCGARIELEKLPLSISMTEQLSQEESWQYALSGGDDYELCFTLPPSELAACPFTVIGEITASTELKFLLSSGEDFPLTDRGYQHF